MFKPHTFEVISLDILNSSKDASSFSKTTIAPSIFFGENNQISLQFKVLIEEGCTFSDMIYCIAHEFQHYLDRLSFETPEQWFLAYEKNVNYYEYKANRFASKKLKRLTKNVLLDGLKQI